MNATNVAQAAARAGFSGTALATIVAIVNRESGGNPAAQGDLTLQDGTWGPSVGLYQIRTVRSETGTGSDRDIQALIPGAIVGVPGTGTPDVDRQSQAAFNISGGGTNFTPWSTYAGLTDADISSAQRLIGDAGISGVRTVSSGGSLLADDPLGLTSAMDSALGSFLGLPDGETVSEYVVQMSIRTMEVIGGAILFAVGAMMIITIVSGPPGDVQGMIRRGIVAGKELTMMVATKGAA